MDKTVSRVARRFVGSKEPWPSWGEVEGDLRAFDAILREAKSLKGTPTSNAKAKALLNKLGWKRRGSWPMGSAGE